MNELDIGELKRLLSYDSSTGAFVWRESPNRKIKIGATAGSFDKEGYRQITIFGTKYPAHRVAWAMTYGVWPLVMLDHKNGVKSDNWILNLREATNAINQHNQRSAPKNSSTGLLGVHRILLKNGEFRWKAQIKVAMRKIPLGSYKDPLAAHQAYLNAKRALHLGCTI